MQLDNMALFASVVTHGSFTVAAHALDLPISTVSRRIADLERTLSIRLLERTTRSLKVTEAGRVYYEHCKALRDRADEADRALQRLQHEPSGRVRMSVPFGVDSMITSAMISTFMEEYRKISIDIIVAMEPAESDLGDLDLKLTFGQKPVTHHRTALLGNADLCFHASPRYVGRYGNPKQPDDLAQHQLIRYIPIPIETYAPEPVSIAGQYRVSTNDLIMARQACLDGLGIAWLPSLICAPSVSAGHLLRIMPDFRFALPIWLTTRTVNASTTKSSILADHFLRTFQSDKAWRQLEGLD